jgi:tetratricopeptide (TPR) repeat protein
MKNTRFVLLCLLTIHFLSAGETLDKNTMVELQLDLRPWQQAGVDIEQVAVMGNRWPLSWDLNNVQKSLFDADEAGMWKIRLNFPAGTERDIAFKFVFFEGGEWRWENLPGYVNHVMYIGGKKNSAAPVFRLQLDPMYDRIVPLEKEFDGHLIDHYQAIGKKTGQRAASEGYIYYRAVDKLLAGQGKKAEKILLSDPVRGQDPLYLDDFYWIWVRQLQAELNFKAAAKIAEKNFAALPPGERKAFWGYVFAETYFNAGEYKKARKHLRKLLKANYLTDEVRENSLLTMGLCQLHFSDKDSLRSGLAELEAMTGEIKDANRHRLALLNLQNGYEQVDDTDKYTETSRRLSQTGGKRERQRAQLQTLKGEMKRKNFEKVRQETTAMLNKAENPEYVAGLRFYQAQATLKLDGADAALPLFASLAEELGYTQYGQRAANLLEKRQKKSGDKAGRRI